MIDPVTLEHLFITVGLLPILRAKPTLWKYQLEQGAALPKTIRSRLARFLATEAFQEAKDLPDFDYDEVLKLVSSGQTPEQTAALFDAVPDRELATDLGVKADRLQTWARGIIPRESPAGGLNPQMDPPDDASLADFRRVWQVACDPMSVLDDLEDGSLSEDQVAALALLYPAMFADMSQAVAEVVPQIAARRDRTWEPSPTKAALIAVLRQREVVDLSLAADVQAIFLGHEQEEAAAVNAPPPPPASNGNGMTEGTPGQDAAGG